MAIVGLGYLLYKRPIQIVETPAKITKYEIVRYCQGLAVYKNDQNKWGYNECIEQLEKAAKEDLLRKSETI